MKKILLLVSFAVCMTFYGSAQTTFALRGGVNFQTIKGDEDESNKMTVKYHLGAQADIPVGTDLYFQPGLIYSTKGAKAKETLLGETFETKLNIAYIDIPLSLVYKPEVGAGRLILGAGPYVAFGVGGKLKFEGGGESEEVDVEFKNDVKDSDPDDKAYIKRIDAGGNIFAGFEFTPNIFVQANAQVGFANLTPKYNGEKPDTKVKNVGFGISIGYRF